MQTKEDNPSKKRRRGFKVLKKTPLTVRWILLSLLVFTLSAGASYEQSAMNAEHLHPPAASGQVKSVPLQLASPESSNSSDSITSGASNFGSVNSAPVAPSTPPPAEQSVTATIPAPSPSCVSSTIPYQTTFVNDPTLLKGEQNVTTYGINGYTVSCDGTTSQTVPAQNEIVAIGTGLPQPTPPAKTYEEALRYCSGLPGYMGPGTTNAMEECITDFLQS